MYLIQYHSIILWYTIPKCKVQYHSTVLQHDTIPLYIMIRYYSAHNTLKHWTLMYMYMYMYMYVYTYMCMYFMSCAPATTG